MAHAQGRAYGVLAGNVAFQPRDYHINSAIDSVTATAGGGQGAAYPVISQHTRVTTVATAGDSIALSRAFAGVNLWVTNASANAMQVFADITGSDTIDGVAGSTGVSQMSNSLVLYHCTVDGKWTTVGLGQGFASAVLGLPTTAFATIAANATGTQASGVAITTPVVFVTSGGSAYSVTLPVSAPGMVIDVITVSGSAHTVAVFPNAGGTTTETINALSANAGITMANLTSATFLCSAAGQWYTNPRVPS